MPSTNLEIILNKIEAINPHHALKLRHNIDGLGEWHAQKADLFFGKYIAYLQREHKTIDFGVECYMAMLDTMMEERIQFIKTGRYSNNSFDEVEKTVYANPAAMVTHMHGLVLAQFLWGDQFERFSFFSNNLRSYFEGGRTYLEIGGGHGLYINEAIALLPESTQFDLVDISQSSIDLAKGIINSDKINYYHKNIYDFNTGEHAYDFITIGEVLEHVEDAPGLLQKTVSLLTDNGICYVTTPINSPMIDHIYLFNNADEIREMFTSAGAEIVEERIAISDNKSAAYAHKNKIPVMYAAFVRKSKQH